MPFKHLRSRSTEADAEKPRTMEERLQRVELELVDLKHDLRALIEILETELAMDLDDDGVIGHTEKKSNGPQIARIGRPRAHRDGPRAPLLPPNYP